MTLSLHPHACAFDLDAANLACLEDALPGWDIRALNGQTAASLPPDWASEEASLLVVAIRGDGRESLKLCRFLAGALVPLTVHTWPELLPEAMAERKAATRKAMLFVLLPPDHDSLVWALQEAGADRCLFLPLEANEVTDILYAVRSRDPDPKFLRDQQKAQRDERWRDDGGPG
jgi:hypothetical protein